MVREMRKLYPPSTLFFALFTICYPLSTVVWAVPPPPGFPLPEGVVCRVNRQAAETRVAALKAAPFFPPPISPTTAYVLVVRVDFSDKTMTKTKAETETFFEKLKEFYLENSYGILTVSATVTNRTAGGSAGAQGSYRLPQTMATYGQGMCSDWDRLAKDAMNAANTDYNIADARADLAGNQPFNHIMIYHAGNGAETTSLPNKLCDNDDIWSVFVPTGTSGGSSDIKNVTGDFFRYAGISFNGVTVVPETEAGGIDPLGVIVHEYGHQLGLPDLYNAQGGGATVVGKWSLMDAGVYIGSPQGSNPAHLDAWSKQFLGFSAPQTVSSAKDQTFSIEQAELSRTAFVRIPIDVSSVGSDKEYFLLEYRRTSGATYDTALPGQGLLIWHIDDSIASNETRLAQNSINNGTPNRGVDLVEADSSNPSTNQGDAGDVWPGSSVNTSFTVPKSNAFNGKESGIVVSGISGAGTSGMSFNVTKLGAGSVIEVASTRVTSYPNPASPSAVKGARAGNDTLTTLVLQLARPFKTAVLTIHNLAGELVRNVPQSEIKLQAGAGLPSADEKWVYEYNWNGKNDDGEPVAPGVYLYRYKLDDSAVRTGRMVIIR